MADSLPDLYALHDGPPDVVAYVRLRARSGLSPKRSDQASAAVAGGWAALLDEIRRRAPAGAWVTLLGDPPGHALYQRHGFVETAPGCVGMAVTI